MGKKVVVAAHALIKRGERYLVTKRSPRDDFAANFWDIPGGTIEFGENIISALKREIREETGLVLKSAKIFFVYGALSNPERHQFQVVYLCECDNEKVVVKSDEHSEYRWANIGEMLKLRKLAFLNAACKKLKAGLLDYQV